MLSFVRLFLGTRDAAGCHCRFGAGRPWIYWVQRPPRAAVRRRVALQRCRRRATRFSCLLHSAAAVSSRASCSPRTSSHSPFDSDASRATGGSPTPSLRAMAPPPGQTNRDTSAADHTTCFYCHQQLILVSHKVIVSRDAHGCSIRICEPCEKEARRRRPVRPLFLRSRRRRRLMRSLPPRRSRSRRKMKVSRPCASSWAAPPMRTRRKLVKYQLCLNLTRLLADEVANARKLLSN